MSSFAVDNDGGHVTPGLLMYLDYFDLNAEWESLPPQLKHEDVAIVPKNVVYGDIPKGAEWRASVIGEFAVNDLYENTDPTSSPFKVMPVGSPCEKYSEDPSSSVSKGKSKPQRDGEEIHAEPVAHASRDRGLVTFSSLTSGELLLEYFGVVIPEDILDDYISTVSELLGESECERLRMFDYFMSYLTIADSDEEGGAPTCAGHGDASLGGGSSASAVAASPSSSGGSEDETGSGCRNYIIDGRFFGSLARYINHSCEPSCEVQQWRRVKSDGTATICNVVVSIRDIQAGEELTLDYGWNKPNQPCRCGSDNCRGNV